MIGPSPEQVEREYAGRAWRRLAAIALNIADAIDEGAPETVDDVARWIRDVEGAARHARQELRAGAVRARKVDELRGLVRNLEDAP